MRILLFQKMKKETAPVLELLKNIREVHFNNRKDMFGTAFYYPMLDIKDKDWIKYFL